MMTKLRQLGGIVNQEGSEGLGFDYSAFMSERESCSRNSAITYFMRECGVIPASESVEVKGSIYVWVVLTETTEPWLKEHSTLILNSTMLQSILIRYQ